MAKQEARREQQEQQSQGQHRTQGSHQGGEVARRSGYDPFGLAVAPGALFRMSPFSIMNPFTIMRRMMDDMDRLFEDSQSRPENGGAQVWAPRVEVTKRNGDYVVRADLAGLKPEDVKVEVVDNALVLEGERKSEREENQGGVYRSEVQYGRFYRTIPLPEGANTEQARAKFENGVLEVDVPVAEPQPNRREVPIQPSSNPGTSASGTSAGTSDKAA